MRHYKHLTLYERENILFLRAKGYSITAIAKSMGSNTSIRHVVRIASHITGWNMPVFWSM
ncbi:helix-turn-helix domain-containing protein [Selenomonas sp.]|uniref:helix-turn-helix domain-containing protein n=1 Tax=Selenomonas sp. TaxID=2053611 RepID=UPI0025E8911C|nr:helix-turn-helix domain-containing protein [Selenomonas sp.]